MPATLESAVIVLLEKPTDYDHATTLCCVQPTHRPTVQLLGCYVGKKKTMHKIGGNSRQIFIKGKHI